MSRHNQHQPHCLNRPCTCHHGRVPQGQRMAQGHNVMAVTALLNHDLPITRHGNHRPVGHAVTTQSRHDAGGPTATTLSQQPGSPSRTRRDNRPDYTEEEAMFVWYHRIDLNWGWYVFTVQCRSCSLWIWQALRSTQSPMNHSN